jgi:CBS domain-containing protein
MATTVKDLMTERVIAVAPDESFKEIVRRMVRAHVSAVPVVDRNGRVLGVVSEADLIVREERSGLEHGVLGHRFHGAVRAKAEGLIAADLMSRPAVTIPADASPGEAARIMRRRRVKRLPVVDERGRSIGIVSRGDLLPMFLRHDREIAREIREDVIQRALWIDADSVRVVVDEGVVTLEGQLETRRLGSVLLELVREVPGVVGIHERLGYLEDEDRGHAGSSRSLMWMSRSALAAHGPGKGER